MGFSEEYEKLRKKELEAAEQETDSKAKTFSDAYNKLRPKQVTKKKQEEWSLEAVRQAARNIGRTGTIEPGSGTWFTGGAFEDGYDFGDLTRTVLGTASDAVDDLFTGAVGIVEPVIDTGAFLAGGVGSIFGADEFADDMRKFIKDDLIDEEAVGEGLGYINPAKWGNALLGGSVEENSVLGEKADALAQSGGQMAATIGLQAVHVPWWVTTSVTSFGSAAETAFKEGGGYGEATLRGVVSAGAEVLTEKLFGGSGLKEKGMFNLDGLTKGIADKAVKALADFGVDMAAEGVEEVVSEFINNLGSALYKEEDLGTILASEEALEGYLDAFIGGAILSGTMNVGKVTNSVKKGQDYRTGLTANEQKVFDSEYQKRLDEAGEISKKEKAKIYDDVMEDLKKGYISTDRIQEVLGGETFDTYKDLYSKETEIRDEYEELKKSKKRTAEEQARYKELGEQIKMLDDSSFKNSINEEVKRKQRFEADLSKYDGKQADVVKKAVESGILNNSGKTHEFVDMIARMSAEKGVDFDFTNNKKLRASGFAVDGATVNGYVTKDGVTLNVDSNKSWQFVVGHEITHVLEGTELYKGLQSAVAEYAKAKGDYQGRLDSIKNLYKDVKDADIDAEITADLVGEYLFSDEAFIRNLSAKNRNVFQKIYDEIKYLLNIATAGSKEARQLEKIKKMFETAYRESGAYVPPSSAIKYNLAAVESHKKKMQDVYSIQSSVELTDLLNRYDKIVEIWERLGGKLDSKFLNDWNEQKGKDRAFTVFKAQSGYKYNIELSSMCKKGVPLFEAIDKIITQEVMDQLNTDIIGKAEKEILYDILKNHDFEIPCAICYVEQARQREGAIINDFLNGREDIAKLGWNQTLARVQDEMNRNGVNYTFPSVDRSIATAKYMPADIAMDEATQTAFYSALQKIANEEIARYNAAENKNRPFVTDVTPEAIKKAFKGNISANLKIFRTLFSEPSSRFMIDRDLLYSSMTTRNLADTHNALYSVFNAQSGAAGYKTKQGTVVYWGDVLGKNWQASKLRNEGGARYQSNSDSQMYTLLDQAQMYMDFTAKGYYLQSYTKVLSHLKLFGLSRGKINASLIPSVYVYRNADGTVDIARTMENAGLDPDGELLFDDFEGINHAEAFMLIADPEYSKSVGGICIGYSDNHIFKMLDDQRIQLIIGFHDKTNNPEKRYAGARYAKNYNGENEAVNKDGKTVHVGFNKYVQKAEKMFAYDGKTESFSGQTAYNGKTYSANDIPRLAADIYLDDCESKGYTPAYNTFKGHSNYYKLLADFSLYDSNGQYAPHKKVAYEMPDKVPYLDENGAKQYMDTEKFIEVELAKEMKVRDSIAEALADDSENGIIPQFVKRVNEQAKKSLADSAERDASGTALSDLRYEGAEPITEDIAPAAEEKTAEAKVEKPKQAGNATADQEEKIAQIRKATPKGKEGSWLTRAIKKLNRAVTVVGDKGWEIENLSKKTGNRELEAKYDFMKNRSSGVAQEYIHDNLLPIIDKIEKYGEDFDLYTRHLHNINRMSLDSESDKARRAEIKSQLEGYTEKQIKTLASEKITSKTTEDRAKQIRLAQEYMELGGERGKNKPVFGDSVTAEVSRKKVAEYEAANPEFKPLAKEVHDYFRELRKYAVNQGLIEKSVADEWEQMYPYYVPTRRTDKQGANVSVPLDTRKTGINNPFKRATGGNSDFEPLSDTMAKYTMQIFRAVHRNRFGIELKNALDTLNGKKAEEAEETKQSVGNGTIPAGTKVKASDRNNIGEIVSYDPETGKYAVFFKNAKGQSATVKLGADILTPLDDLKKKAEESEVLKGGAENDGAVLTPAQNGKPPSFTVFVKGKRVTFDITEELYQAIKPAEGILADTYTIPNEFAKRYKKLLTEYDPFFALLRNPIKDAKDVLFNSRHAWKTYITAPKAFLEIKNKGEYYKEYIQNGGETTSYYNSDKGEFTKGEIKKPKSAKGVLTFPWRSYKNASEKLEMFWRLSEYIASREAGESIEKAMLDSARVTTNFGAGGDLTKWANRNGAMFLNPSVQGAMQIGRNVREAYHGGLKGSAILAAKVIGVGLSGMMFNWLLWDDDEEYAELSDYVKQNYFLVGKTEDGKFIRIPKGRMEAVIQNGFEQMANLITGNDDVDFEAFWTLVKNNLAPNSFSENNILSPLLQAKNNETWYGGELVPSRLQDFPVAEQFDESTDAVSKWLGEVFNISPYKINYVLKQYGGGLADLVLPALTEEAEGSTLLAPIADQFVSDSLMKNQSITDFYDLKDELTANANSVHATDEDVLKNKYFSHMNSEISDLYKVKRAIQNSDLPDSEKYAAVREVQKQIAELAKASLDTYDSVTINGEYATVGGLHFRLNDKGEWAKMTDKQVERMAAFTRSIEMTESDYLRAAEDLSNLDADKDENGNAISGSRKQKVIEYINSLDVDYGAKIIFYKSEYPSDDTYNADILDYLNGRDDLSYDDIAAILKELGFTVYADGSVEW